MKAQDLSRLKTIIDKFDTVKVLVIGDLILDEFIWGDVSRISPEAPVPVVWVQRENFMPGGASNVANNIAALDSKSFITGLVGSDLIGKRLSHCLKARRNINIDGMIVDAKRPTTLKTRVIAHSQQVVRIDKEKVEDIDAKLEKKIISYTSKIMDKIDAVLIEDYGKGVITPGLLHKLVKLAKAHKKIITVDPKSDHFSFYKGVTAITPNKSEAAEASGIKVKNEEDLVKVGKKLLSDLKCRMVLITRGEEGMTLFENNNGRIVHIPTVAQEVFDVSGAGDTVISTFTVSLCCGATPVEAAHIANFAAGIVVGKVGTACVNRKELWESILKEEA